METTPDLPEILYISDPLCAWCYGMSPVLQRIKTEYAGRVQVSVLSGGMVTGAEVGPIGEVWADLSSALEPVAKVTGVEFGAAFRALGEEGRLVQNSEPPCRAIAIFRQLDDVQHRAVSFAHDVQRAYFHAGQDLNNPATYEPLVARYGLDVAEFRRRWASAEAAQATQKEFAAVAKLGVKGFPTTILRVGNQGYLLARGFEPYAQFARGLEQALAQAGEEAGQ
ncbi:DsbA family protein [Hymenobacter persicinus]|uniref:DsbA family protein n=1 Tax=Hymenobacter persicinus TaxID=2025506 RepID=A0A4Q5LBF8_9BACT|nr:DsbA family protein [Hymenobacter persicinus]RYU79720.1 DsbA family protein [Hymenobacter persicinus]